MMEINITPMDLTKNDPKTYFYPQIKQLLEAKSMDDVELNILGLSGPGAERYVKAIANGIKYFITDLRNDESFVYANAYWTLKNRKESYELIDFAFDVIETIISGESISWDNDDVHERYDAMYRYDKDRYVSFIMDNNKLLEIHGEDFCERLSVPYMDEEVMLIDPEILMLDFFRQFYRTYLGTWCESSDDPEIRDIRRWVVGPH